MRNQGGFTILEFFLSLALTGLITAMVLPFLRMQTRLWERQGVRREEYRTLTSALWWLTREVQEAGYHKPGKAIRGLERDRIVYELSRDEADPEEFSEGNRRLVTVYRQGDDLMYHVQAWDSLVSGWRLGSTQILASGISDVSFLGKDNRGDPAACAGEAAALEIALSGRRSGVLRTLVALRNGGGGGCDP